MSDARATDMCSLRVRYRYRNGTTKVPSLLTRIADHRIQYADGIPENAPRANCHGVHRRIQLHDVTRMAAADLARLLFERITSRNHARAICRTHPSVIFD